PQVRDSGEQLEVVHAVPLPALGGLDVDRRAVPGHLHLARSRRQHHLAREPGHRARSATTAPPPPPRPPPAPPPPRPPPPLAPRSWATTSLGARAMKSWFASFASSPESCRSSRASSPASRLHSRCTSISPSSATKTSLPSTSTAWAPTVARLPSNARSASWA